MTKEQPDQYGNTESDFNYCSFPDCGCDGERLCIAKNGPSGCALALNLEKGYFKRQRDQLLKGLVMSHCWDMTIRICAHPLS